MTPQICGHWFSMVFLQWVFIATGFWCDWISPRVWAERVGIAQNIWRLTPGVSNALSIPFFVFQTQKCFSSTAKLTCEDMSISSAVTRPRFGNYYVGLANGHMICIDLCSYLNRWSTGGMTMPSPWVGPATCLAGRPLQPAMLQVLPPCLKQRRPAGPKSSAIFTLRLWLTLW